MLPPLLPAVFRSFLDQAIENSFSILMRAMVVGLCLERKSTSTSVKFDPFW